jgi:hypothetical protein
MPPLLPAFSRIFQQMQCNGMAAGCTIYILLHFWHSPSFIPTNHIFSLPHFVVVFVDNILPSSHFIHPSIHKKNALSSIISSFSQQHKKNPHRPAEPAAFNIPNQNQFKTALIFA